MRWGLVAIWFCLAGAAAAQEAVTSDLTGDGRPESFRLIDNDGMVDLEIRGDGGTVLARGIAWKGGIGQEPDLSLAPNGSVRLSARNESIGRDRWVQVLTIAFRQGRYVVAGLTYDWYDTLDPANTGRCDFNLLAGRGVVQRGDAPERQVRVAKGAVPVTDWHEDRPLPAECPL